MESVYILDPDDAELLFLREGPYPERYVLRPWLAYHEYYQKPMGILFK